MKSTVEITVILAFTLLVALAGFTEKASAAEPNQDSFREAALNGPSIQIDPSFPYYQGRSAESIAEEIALAGYRSVHYFVVNENVINGELIKAFRDHGIPVWAMVLGNGTYSTAGYPEQWPEWRTVQLVPPADGFVHFSLNNEEFREWKKARIAKLLADYPFDGIELAEPYLPSWLGLENGTYGDVGPHAQAAFEEKYGKQMPNFTDPSSPRYYLNDKETYADWVEFRVETVNGFGADVINGPGGVREARPDILVATWTLGIDAGPDSVNMLRERQGIDAAAMVTAIRPDIHFIQTHWPDWVKPELPPDYPVVYEPFVEQLRAVHPDFPIGIQADIGSLETMLRSSEWVNTFSETVDRLGYSTWTAYEYHLGEYMYTEKPMAMKAQRGAPGWVIVSFNKRVSPESAMWTSNFSFEVDGRRYTADTTFVDGSRVFVQSRNFPDGPFELEIQGIIDTPELWLFKGYPANEVPEGTRIAVD